MNTGTKKKVWFSVSVLADAAAEEALDTAFGILDSSGTEIDLLRNTGSGEVVVVGYFEKEPQRPRVEEIVNESLVNFGLETGLVKEIKFQTVPERDWLKEWKKHWKPTYVGSFIISPPWAIPAESEGKIIVSIDPSMAFGTGTHETTKLCLGLIEKHFDSNESFLDVGTGTGVLSIAAAKMTDDPGPEQFAAFDIDDDSILIARENAVLNSVPFIRIEPGTISRSTQAFDFVCANLTYDAISPILPLLLEKSTRILVLSGILGTQETAIKNDLRSLGYREPLIAVEGEWIAAAVLK